MPFGPLATGGSGGAPANAEYVVLALHAGLTDERVLTQGSGITIVDGGAGGNVTVSVSALILNTRANILAMSPPSMAVALATDTREFLIWDTSDWNVAPLESQIETSTPDMGPFNPGGLGLSDKAGYYADVITDKILSNVGIGGNARTENGGIRIDVTQDPDTFEIYLRGAWQDIIYDFDRDNGDLRHTPLSEEIHVESGNSVTLGLNGLPIVQEYQVSMGAYPVPRIIDGGTF